MHSRMVTCAVVTAALTCVLPGTPATADPGPVATHFEPGPVVLPAGAMCAFGVRISFPVTDLTRYTWFAGGRRIAAVETGTMLADFTNTGTGRTVRRDLSGTGYYAYPDPRTVILSGTRIAALLGPGDTPPSRLLLSNGSPMAVRSGTTGKVVLVSSPTAEDICRTLR
ncbi:hypothetical protein GCM10010171_57070 [Actinokineospora fastidiosa]|uniref:Secreted protein n=1 Tax=Actinokineospora fastidiosa TaxID=1816 RepID=A0A918GQE1_9PSEU|nr:hypothetical protein GCM10010171_57070 [Actinokineospora fastidiosa]